MLDDVPRRMGYSVRRLASGRWQVRVRHPDTGELVPVVLCDTEAEADRLGRAEAADAMRGRWHDPRRGQITVDAYLTSWLARRRSAGDHGRRYSLEADRLVRLYVTPRIGAVRLAELTVGGVRAWYDDLRAERIAESLAEVARAKAHVEDLERRPRAHRQLPAARRRLSVAQSRAGKPGLVPAKAYRVLRAALADAARDELIQKNPADIRGAGVEHSPERPLVEPEQIAALAAAAPERWRALILVAAWCGLRFGELAALQGKDVDVLHRTITVRQALVDAAGEMAVKEPKSAAGRRIVHMPDQLVPILEEHLARFAEPGPEGFVFVGELGGMMRRANWSKQFGRWVAAAGIDGIVFHDLRHAAGTLAAQAGATERELQRRLGHASPNAARRYQHAADRRDLELADRLGGLVGDSLVARSWHAEVVNLPEKAAEQDRSG